MLKTELEKKTAESMKIYQAATGDGYWEDAALNDLRYIFLLGQLHATKSIHNSSAGNNTTRLRIKTLAREIKELKGRLL